MTISEVLAMVDDIKANAIPESSKVRWLSELDGRIFNDVILTHEHDLVEDENENMVEPTFTGYDENSENEELLAPDTYADIYRHYLYAMMAYSTGETDRYSNSLIMFNNSYQEYLDWYNRTHKPIQKPLSLF